MQLLGIDLSIKIDVRKYYFRTSVVGFQSQYAAYPELLFSIAFKSRVIYCKLLEDLKIVRVMVSGALKGPDGFFPLPLTPLDETGKIQYLRIIWQSLAGNFHLIQSTVIIEVSPVEIPRACEVRFACLRTEAKGRLKGCFRQGQARWRVVVTKEIKRVMSKDELAISLEKRWITHDRLAEQIDGLQPIPSRASVQHGR